MRRIITVGREFGSGGREIGRRIAEELQIAYYDQEIITEIAKRTALSEAYIRQMKIMFLIITLSIIINVGNSTVVMAKENIVTEIVDFPVTINYEEYNVDDYNANDMMLCEYPMVVYKNMTYIPLTYYNCILLGLEVQFDKNILSVEKRDSGKPTEYLRDQSSEKNTKNIINMEVSPFIVNIQDNNYNDEEYPALFYKNIVYLPLTWKVVYDYMKWDYFYGKKYSDSITGIELYTDSFYVFSKDSAHKSVAFSKMGTSIYSLSPFSMA